MSNKQVPSNLGDQSSLANVFGLDVDRRKIIQILSSIPFIANADGFVNQLYAQNFSSNGLANSEEFDLELEYDPATGGYIESLATPATMQLYSSMYATRGLNTDWTLNHISSFIKNKYIQVRKHIVSAAMYKALQKNGVKGYNAEDILANTSVFNKAAAEIDKRKLRNEFTYYTQFYSYDTEGLRQEFKNRKPTITFTKQELNNAINSALNKTEDQLSDFHMHKQAKFNQIELFLSLTTEDTEVKKWQAKADRGIENRRKLWCLWWCKEPEFGGLEQDPAKGREKYLRLNKSIIRSPVEREKLHNTRDYFWTAVLGKHYTVENKIKHGHAEPTFEKFTKPISMTVREKGKEVIYKLDVTNSTRYKLSDINHRSIQYFVDEDFKKNKTYFPGRTNKTDIEDQKKALINATTVTTEIVGDPYIAYLIASRVMQGVAQVAISAIRFQIDLKLIDIAAYQADLESVVRTTTSLTTESQSTAFNVHTAVFFLTGTTFAAVIPGLIRYSALNEKLRSSPKTTEAEMQRVVDSQAKTEWQLISTGSSSVALIFFRASLMGYSTFYQWIRYLIPASFAVSDFTSSVSELYQTVSRAKKDKDGKPIYKNSDYASIGIGIFRGATAACGLLSYVNRGRAWTFKVNNQVFAPVTLTSYGAALSALTYFIAAVYVNS